MMINEILECQDYLQGKNINPKNLYRPCFLLSKWYEMQNMTPVQIRSEIFTWAGTYRIHIDLNLNSIISQASRDKRPLASSTVFISESDIFQIQSRFDKTNTKLIALALLCYAKAHGDKDLEFGISLDALAHWVQIHKTNISGRYLPEMIAFGFILKKETSSKFLWNKKVNSKNLLLQMSIPISNQGIYSISDNNIRGLYEKIFT